MAAAIPQSRNHSIPAASGVWVEGSLLGVSARRINQLYHELVKYGAARREGKLYLFRRNHPAISSRVRAESRRRARTDLTGLSETQIAIARDKERTLRVSTEEIAARMGCTGCGRTAAVEWYCRVRVPELSTPEVPDRMRLAFPDGVPVGTFRRWEKVHRTKGLAGLVDRRGGDQRTAQTCSEDAWQYFKLLYLDKRKPTRKKCWRRTCNYAAQHGLTWLSYGACCQRVNAEIPKGTLVLKREGLRAWQAQCAPRMQRDIEQVYTLQVWCGDEHTLDFFCRVRGRNGEWKRTRPVLTAWMDVRSRYFVGWHIDATGNSDTILAAAKHGIARFGPPAMAYIDNGEDYKSAAGKRKKWAFFNQQRLANAFAELDIDVTWAIPYQPWSKPIESNFRWVCEEFSKDQRSYCGNRPENKPDDVLAMDVMALPTIAEVRELFAAALEDIHAIERCGSGAYGKCPAELINLYRDPVARAIPDPQLLDYLCARVLPRPATVSKYGVKVDGVHYGSRCSTLHRYLGKQVRVKLHPDTRDYVDIVSLDGKPLCRAHNDVLRGTQPEDIRLAQSARKRALAEARKGAEAVAVLRRSPTSLTMANANRRRRDEAERFAPPEPPQVVQPVRPDIAADVRRITTEPASHPVRTTREPSSIVLNFDAIAEELGLAGSESADDATPPLGSGVVLDVDRLYAADACSDADDDVAAEDELDDAPADDVFSALGRMRHERRA